MYRGQMRGTHRSRSQFQIPAVRALGEPVTSKEPIFWGVCHG
jgi:hypothetical protein